MKLNIIKFIVLSIMLVPATYAEDGFSETKEDQLFPQNVIIEHNAEQLDLSLTGLTIRKKFFLKIYSMAHYINQKPGVSGNDIYRNILQNNGAKQISMVFLRALTAEQIQKSLLKGIKVNTNEEEYLQILPQVEKFMQAIYEDVKRNDEFIIRWLPDGTLVSIFQGKEISTIKNEQFARTLWLIWFGENSIVDRESLIKQLLTSS